MNAAAAAVSSSLSVFNPYNNSIMAFNSPEATFSSSVLVRDIYKVEKEILTKE
jgi:hypothetical protein